MEKIKRHNYVDTIEQVLGDEANQHIMHLTTGGTPISGRLINLHQKDVINFGSCSYLGLETDPRLINGIIEKAQMFGAQFSSSRAYVSIHPYEELEFLLSSIFQNETIVTPTTTLGHIAAIPVLVNKEDAIILDHQVHASVQMAVQLVKAKGVFTCMIRHNRLDMLVEQIKKLKQKYKHIWYMADGVYSMYGDAAPMEALTKLADEFEQFYLYVDDAHGMSWAGKNGSGYALNQVKQHPKMILATSLVKGFASGGAALVFPNPKWAKRVMTCGGTLIFSGPVQPPMLGAAIASAKIHLSDEIIEKQKNLREKILFTNQLIKESGLPFISESETPIFFIATGLPKVVYNLVERLLRDGFYTNTAAFPAVPIRKGGVRFTVTAHITKEDIRQLIACIQHHYPLALAEEGTSSEEVDYNFAVKKVPTEAFSKVVTPTKLKWQCYNTIHDVKQDEWDNLFLEKGSFDYSGMKFLESCFKENEQPVSKWDFYYFVVKDQQDKIVLATFFTVAMMKDDMFAEREVSEQLEQQRQQEPLLFTSKAVMLGSLLTEGQHLYLDYQHPDWKQALGLLTKELEKVQNESEAAIVMLRDFVAGSNEELKKELLKLGFVEYSLPPTHHVGDMNWSSTDEYLKWLPQKSRWFVRREILDFEKSFTLRYDNEVTEQELDECYQLYSSVHQRGG